MNWPALWKEAGIDPESDETELIMALIKLTIKHIDILSY
jgi:hypothetical protein